MPSRAELMIGGMLAIALVASPAAWADPSYEVEPVSQNALPGNLIHDPMSIRWDPEGPNKRVKIVESEGVPGGQAISFQVRRTSRDPWDIRLRAPFDNDISKGEAIEIYFWARAANLPRGKDAGKIDVILQRDKEPYDTVISENLAPTPDWKMYKVSGVTEADFPANESEMGFNFGDQKQTIELGPFFAVSLGDAAAATPEVAAIDTPEAPTGYSVSGNFEWSHGDGVSSNPIEGETADVAGLSVTNDQTKANVWDAHAGASDLGVGVAAGDELELVFWARAVSGMGDVSAVLQRREEPFDTIISRDLLLSSGWEKYSVYGVSASDVEAGKLGFVVHLGHTEQTIEFGSFTLTKTN